MHNKFLRTSVIALNLGVAIIAGDTTWSGKVSAATLDASDGTLALFHVKDAPFGGYVKLGVSLRPSGAGRSYPYGLEVAGSTLMGSQQVAFASWTLEHGGVSWRDFVAADGEVTMKIQWPGQGPYPFENIWWVAAKDIPAPDDKGMETLAYLNTLKYSLACTDTHPDTAEPSCDLTVTRE